MAGSLGGTLLLAGAVALLLRRRDRKRRSFGKRRFKKRPSSGGLAELTESLLGGADSGSVPLLNPVAPLPLPPPLPLSIAVPLPSVGNGSTSLPNPITPTPTLPPTPTPPSSLPCPVTPAATAAPREPIAFTQPQLETATDGFAEGMKLDEGAFGSVFRGVLADGRVVAIKVLKPEATARVVEKGEEEWTGAGGFRKELEVLGKHRQQNIVELLGFCLDDAAGGGSGSKEKKKGHGGTPATLTLSANGDVTVAPALPTRQCLVFEFMAGGSLWARLAVSSAAPPLSCQERFSIASDVARGLEYLHVEASPQIIHQDVKTDNILLAVNNGVLVAKLADFGSARFAPDLLKHFGSLNTHHSTCHIVGTTPYMPGEYLQMGHVSEKTDTYAFGVVLLELLTGKPPFDEGTKEVLPYAMARPLADAEQQLPPMLDKRIGDGDHAWPLPCALALGRIANRCIAPIASERCVVADVLPELDALAGRQVVLCAVRSTLAAALAARQDAASLVGRRIDVEGRGEGVVTGVQAALGKPTIHLVKFASEPAAGALPVLLQKQEGGKGAKFYLIAMRPAQ